jgi:4-hydroxybenzoate polyprenyltransferase
MSIRALGIDSAGFFFTNRIYVAAMPLLLMLFWNQVLRLPLPPEYYLMIVLTTAGGYLYNMHTDGAEDALNYAARYRLFLPDSTLTKITMFALFAASFLIALRAGWMFTLYGAVVNFVFSLYSKRLPVAWKGRPLRIKEIPFLKNIYAALCWSAALVLTPYVYLNLPVNDVAWLAILLSFGMDYHVELLWDFRDMAGDSAAGFRTVPLAIGEPAAFWLLRLVHALTFGLIAYLAAVGRFPQGFLIAALHVPAGIAFFEWYRRLQDKEWASHLYVLYCGVLLCIAIAWNLFLPNGGMSA